MDDIGSTRAAAILQMTCVEVEAWEGEGGSTPGSADALTGTASQVEWAERIKRQVNAEFDRVAAAFRSVASKQRNEKRAETEYRRPGAADDISRRPLPGHQKQPHITDDKFKRSLTAL
jgi:hypothetical protein